MNSTTFTTSLAQALNDPGNALYSVDALQAAMIRAVQAYSRYRPMLRRIGTGSLTAAVSASATTLTLAGGVFAAGDSLLLDSWTPAVEAVTIASAERFSPGSGGDVPVAQTQVTLTSATANAHAENAFATLPTPGLSIVSGHDTYALPFDFVAPDEGSFDLATGQKWRYHADNSFYDASIAISENLSGVFFGSSTNYGPTNVGLAGSPGGPNPNGVPPCAEFGCGAHWRFLRSDAPQLIVSSAPCGARLLDFYYWGSHTIGSVPSSDLEAVLQYAIYAALTQRIGTLSGLVDLKMSGGEESMPSKMTTGLNAVASTALAEFNKLIVTRPIAVSG